MRSIAPPIRGPCSESMQAPANVCLRARRILLPLPLAGEGWGGGTFQQGITPRAPAPRSRSANRPGTVLTLSTSVIAGATGGFTLPRNRSRAFAVERQSSHVAHEHIEPDEVARRAAGRRKRIAEIAKHLVRLRLEIVSADEVAVAVERGLPGDENERPAARLDHVRVAQRRRQLRGMVVLWEVVKRERRAPAVYLFLPLHTRVPPLPAVERGRGPGPPPGR